MSPSTATARSVSTLSRLVTRCPLRHSVRGYEIEKESFFCSCCFLDAMPLSSTDATPPVSRAGLQGSKHHLLFKPQSLLQRGLSSSSSLVSLLNPPLCSGTALAPCAGRPLLVRRSRRSLVMMEEMRMRRTK